MGTNNISSRYTAGATGAGLASVVAIFFRVLDQTIVSREIVRYASPTRLISPRSVNLRAPAVTPGSPLPFFHPRAQALARTARTPRRRVGIDGHAAHTEMKVWLSARLPWTDHNLPTSLVDGRRMDIKLNSFLTAIYMSHRHHCHHRSAISVAVSIPFLRPHRHGHFTQTSCHGLHK